MTENTRLRELDPGLFGLVNTIKTTRMIYRKINPQLYSEILDRQSEIDQVLGYDDCYLRVVPDKGLIVLSFFPDDDDYTNRLRKKLTTTEMKLYAVLLQLYTERYISAGDYVTAGTEDLIDTWERLGFSERTSNVSKSYLMPHIRTMKRCGILAESGNEQYVIQPGIMFGLDIRALMDYYSNVLLPWFGKLNGGTAPSGQEQV